jgi:hypothetical protein
MDNEQGKRTRHGDDCVLIARIAAAERWGHTADRTAATEPARRALRAKFEREADPDGALSAQERARRTDLGQRLFGNRLSELVRQPLALILEVLEVEVKVKDRRRSGHSSSLAYLPLFAVGMACDCPGVSMSSGPR